jgi:hypothetical protein
MMTAAAAAAETKTTTNNQADSIIFIPQEEIFCGVVNVKKASTHVIFQ